MTLPIAYVASDEASHMNGADLLIDGILRPFRAGGRQPVWYTILARGGTFTWEVWEPSDADGDSMSHGFSANVLVAIQQSFLDNGDSPETRDKAYVALRKSQLADVIATTREKQVPWDHSSLVGDVILAR